MMGSSTDSRRAVVTSTSLSKYSPMTSSVSSSEPDCSPTPTISVSILGKYSIWPMLSEMVRPRSTFCFTSCTASAKV